MLSGRCPCCHREMEPVLTPRMEEILTLLREGTTRYAAIAERLGLSKQAIMHHIRKLRKLGVIETAPRRGVTHVLR